ncbi:MAG: PTS sugar transporter subunit IIC [Candidatus Zixiibacteriota bacterium]|nr:MAG: PTS sugar transporter subunit IIC [candidate division Zixibacteria bacterium]
MIFVCIFGGLAALDKTEAFQSMFSQPLVVGPIVGLLLNDLPGGIFVGILFQLVYLWVMPIGAATFPDPAVGAVVGSAGYCMVRGAFPDCPGLVLLLVLVFAVPFSWFAGWTLIKQRQLNSKLLTKADLYAEGGRVEGFGRLLLLGLSGSFLRGFLVTASGILAILVLLAPLVKTLSFAPESLFQKIEIPVWGLGLGSMIFLFGRKKNTLWSVGGAMLAIAILLL